MKNWDQTYKKEGIIQSEVMDLALEAVKHFKKSKAQRILDLGCGTGRHTVFLCREGFDVFGMDISEKGVEITTERLGKESLKANLCIADMHKLPYEDSFFDGALAIYVIEHNTYAGLIKTISEIKRVLKVGGLFCTTLITQNDYKNGIGNEIEPRTIVNPGDPYESDVPHRISSKEEVEELFNDFQIISLEEKCEPSTVSPGSISARWNIIVQKSSK